MKLQICSGMGPVECRAAVGGIYKVLRKNEKEEKESI